MNKVWQEPQVMVQPFVANEYVAACYRVRCTTPKGNGWFNRLFDDTNKNGKWDSEDKLIFNPDGGFRGCNEWHSGVIQDEAPKANGFVAYTDYIDILGSLNQSYAVFWWKEDLGPGTYDYHVMVPGNENYESNPNAS